MSLRSIYTGIICCLAMLALPLFVGAAVTCPQPGEVPILTAEDRAKATAAKIPTTATCWKPTDPYVGASAGEAKQYLKTKLAGAAKARGDVSVTNMNGTFACRLADFLKAGDAAGHNQILIFSGWRDVQAQANAVANSRPGYACRAGGACPHPQGRAADLQFNGVTPKTTEQCMSNAACAWAHQNASRFHLVFPLKGNPLEPWHIEPQERSSVPQNGPCGGTPGPAAPTTAPSPAPTAGLTSAIRQALAPQTAPPAQQPSLTPSQPLTTAQPITNAFTTPTPSPELLPTPTTTNSIADRLEELAFTKTTATTTATSVPITLNARDVGSIHSSSPTPPSSTGSSAGGTVTQNTFVTQDLSTAGAVPRSGFQQALDRIRSILLQYLAYLQPFRLRGGDEVLE